MIDRYEVMGQMDIFDILGPDTWSGKTSPELSAVTKAETSKPSSRRSSASQSQKLPTCLCLRRDGTRPDASTMSWEGGALLGEYTTRSFGECPSEENGSRLSQILEECAPQKYYLSAKACAGILNRAEKRGKDLPEILKTALLNQMEYSNAEN